MYQNWEQFDLNEKIIQNLTENLNFEGPTDIQKKVLVYLRSHLDLIVQAKTGEGKTLCYAIPILNYILDFYKNDESKIKKLSPVALILVPTRELGIQVNQHITAVIKDLDTEINPTGKKNYFNMKIASVLGGFAKQKQIRLLNNNPEIIIATPGRLWEIMENEESAIFNKMHKLRFLVVDEADRMTEKGHFRELKNIVSFVYNKLESANSGDKNDEDVEEKKVKIKQKLKNVIAGENVDESVKKEENKKIKKALKRKGVNVEADNIEEVDLMEMFGNEENLIDNFNFEDEEEGKADEEGENGSLVEEEEINDDDIEQDQNEIDDEAEIDEEEAEEEDEVEEAEDEDEAGDDNIIDQNKLRQLKNKDSKITTDMKPKREIHLRTILCSATIEQVHKSEKKFNKKGKRDKKEEENKDDTKINMDSLVKNLKFYNKLIYVKNKPEEEMDPEGFIEDRLTKSFILPEKLILDCYRCNSSIKDYYLMHILKENEGKTIMVFDNSISHLKKIHSLFSLLDFNLTCLHSKMQQSQRIKNLDRFRTKESKVLFCTDVGARGLDIPKVDLIIHYHIPKTTELFIHRSGRTARANQDGTCVSLISEGETNLYKKIIKDLKLREFSMKTLNVLQLEKYKSLFEYTKKVESEDYQMKKKSREKQWFKKRAEECEMIFDEEDNGDPYADQNEEEEKFLNKKRKIGQKEDMHSKKVYQNILANNLRKTSFLNPDMIKKLNSIILNPKMKGLNLTETINQAETSKFQLKGKQKKKRYQRRRKNK